MVLTEIGGQHYGFYVEDYKALGRGDRVEAKRSYLEALKHEPVIVCKWLLHLEPEHLSVLAFEKPGQKGYTLITKTLTMSPGRSKPATCGQNRSSHSIFVNGVAKVENSFPNKPLRASCVGLFGKEFSTYVDRVAGSILPIAGWIIVPPDTDDESSQYRHVEDAERRNVGG